MLPSSLSQSYTNQTSSKLINFSSSILNYDREYWELLKSMYLKRAQLGLNCAINQTCCFKYFTFIDDRNQFLYHIYLVSPERNCTYLFYSNAGDPRYINTSFGCNSRSCTPPLFPPVLLLSFLNQCHFFSFYYTYYYILWLYL